MTDPNDDKREPAEEGPFGGRSEDGVDEEELNTLEEEGSAEFEDLDFSDDDKPWPDLNPAQHRVLLALLEGKTVTEAAKRGEVSRSTVYRWLEDDEFADCLRAEQRAVRLRSVRNWS